MKKNSFLLTLGVCISRWFEDEVYFLIENFESEKYKDLILTLTCISNFGFILRIVRRIFSVYNFWNMHNVFPKIWIWSLKFRRTSFYCPIEYKPPLDSVFTSKSQLFAPPSLQPNILYIPTILFIKEKNVTILNLMTSSEDEAEFWTKFCSGNLRKPGSSEIFNLVN